MFTDEEIDAATLSYLKARGWSDQTIAIHTTTRAEVRSRMVVALGTISAMRQANENSAPETSE